MSHAKGDNIMRYKLLGINSNDESYVKDIKTNEIHIFTKRQVLDSLECFDISYEKINIYKGFKSEITFEDLLSFIRDNQCEYFTTILPVINVYTAVGGRSSISSLELPIHQRESGTTEYLSGVDGTAIYDVRVGDNVHLHYNGSAYLIEAIKTFAGIGYLQGEPCIVYSSLEYNIFEHITLEDISSEKMSLATFKRQMLL